MENKLLFLNDKAYLDTVARFINLLNSPKKIDELVVILPNYISIELLKLRLINQADIGSAITLPKIITFDDYISFARQKSLDNSSKHYANILLVASIIKSYEKVKYTSKESIRIAKQLVKIYWKLKKSSISIDKIEGWVDEELALHWWATAEFLKFCFENFEDIISSDEDFNIAQTSIGKNAKVIFVGILDNLLQDNLIYDYLKANDKYIILPPGDLSFIKNNSNYRYLQKRYATLLDKETSELLNYNSIEKREFKRQLFEFEDFFDEIDFLLHKIQTRESSITIVTNNSFFNYILANQLTCNGIDFNSSFGSKYIEFAEVEFLINIARIKSENSSISSVIALLKSRMLSSNIVVENFLNTLNDSEKFHEDIFSIIKNENFDEKSEKLLSILLSWVNFAGDRFKDLFGKNLEVFLEIIELYQISISSRNTSRFNEFIIDIKSLENSNFHVYAYEYTDLLSEVFSLKYTKPFNRNADIFILTPDDSLLVDTNEVYFADFNQESYISGTDNTWLTNKILRKLNLLEDEEEFEKLLYLITTKSDKQNIYFTRSTNKEGSLQEKCAILDFIDNVDMVLPERILVDHQISEENQDIQLDQSIFPKILYATNIEMLIRDPYGFFARKILAIRKKKNALSRPENSDFGITVHNLIETKSKNNDLSNIELIDNIFSSKALPEYICLLWKDPVLEILNRIDELNNEANLKKTKIYTEITGSCNIFIEEISIEIRAIADRIEVSEGKIKIIDFKTGQVPSKKDVFLGKSPQLIIEAIILVEGGFGIKMQNKEIEIIYIKINTKSPYIEETIISISMEEILEHKNAMIEFLKYYYSANRLVSSKQLPDFWKPNYSDYEHFRRV